MSIFMLLFRQQPPIATFTRYDRGPGGETDVPRLTMLVRATVSLLRRARNKSHSLSASLRLSASRVRALKASCPTPSVGAPQGPRVFGGMIARRSSGSGDPDALCRLPMAAGHTTPEVAHPPKAPRRDRLHPVVFSCSTADLLGNLESGNYNGTEDNRNTPSFAVAGWAN
jgi:hypothetical protein